MLEYETRNAIVTGDAPLVRRLDVVPGTRMDVSCAQICTVPAGCRGSVTFSVQAVGRQAQPETLFSRKLDRQSGWVTEWIDLDRFAGQRIDLRFTTDREDPAAEGTTPAPRHVALWGEPLLVEPTRKPPLNVILISIDTLRADRLGSYGYGRPTSPALDRLAADGVRFDQAISQSPWTIPSHISLLTSLYPSTHQVNQNLADFREFALSRGAYRVLSDDAVTLAEVLRDHGYTNLALTTAVTMSGKLGFAQGFDRYLEREGKLTPQLGRELARLLEDHRQSPFFLFFHTYEVHTPYVRVTAAASLLDQNRRDRLSELLESPDEMLSLNPKEQQEHLKRLGLFNPWITSALYDGGIRHTDDFLGQLFHNLRSLGLYDRTVIVVTSDHGEEFAEHTDLFYSAHGHTLYDEIIRVPLLMRVPGRFRPGTVVKQVVELIDVAPTVLDLLGLPRPEPMQGRSLVGLIDDPSAEGKSWAASEAMMSTGRPEWKSVRSRQHKYIAAFASENGERSGISGDLLWSKLFDLEQDAGERNDLRGERPETAETLHDLLVRHFSSISDAARHDGSRIELTGPMLEKLRALGYVE